MEFIIGLAMKFWQWTVLIAGVIVAAIINFTDKNFYNKEFNKAMNAEIVADNTRGKFETFANPEQKAKAAEKYKLELGLINKIEYEN